MIYDICILCDICHFNLRDFKSCIKAVSPSSCIIHEHQLPITLRHVKSTLQ